MRSGQNSPVDKSLEKTSPGASVRKKRHRHPLILVLMGFNPAQGVRWVESSPFGREG